MAIDGDTIVVGDYYKSSGKGAVYIFHTSDGGATYDEVAKLTADEAESYDYFGYSVAIAGGTVVVGAYGDDDASGAAPTTGATRARSTSSIRAMAAPRTTWWPS